MEQDAWQRRKIIKGITDMVFQLNEQNLDQIIGLSDQLSVEKGGCFVEKGRRNTNEYLLVSGIARSYLTNDEGVDTTITFFLAPCILSPYTTRTSEGFSIINFQAVTSAELITLDAPGFEQLMTEDKDVRNFGNMVLRSELASKIEKEIAMASLSARQRIMLLRQRYPGIENQVPHSQIASYLGITNISLSRLRAEISQNG